MSFDVSVTLDCLPPGWEGTVVSVGGRPGPTLRLRRLGVRPGARVRAVAAGRWGGPVLVEVDGCRVALGRGLARHILVHPNAASADARA